MNVYENLSLSEILYYKIGGIARYVLKMQNFQDVLEALAFVKENHISRVLPIGLGANILMTEDFFDGAVLWFAKPDEQLLRVTENNLIEAFASHLLDDVIHFSFTHGFVGLEWAGGLPSTVGGAVRGNVGAFGKEIKQLVEKVEVIDTAKDNELCILTNDQFEFSYRESIVKKQPNLIVVRAFFKLQKADENEVADAQNVYFAKIEHRKKYNPIDFPSCGSTFKNITEKKQIEKMLSVWPDMKEQVETVWHGKVSMGYTIKRLRLSGLTIGHGQIAEKHANYLINLGGASFDDIYSLIQKVKETFHQTFGFYPEPEVQIIK